MPRCRKVSRNSALSTSWCCPLSIVKTSTPRKISYHELWHFSHDWRIGTATEPREPGQGSAAVRSRGYRRSMSERSTAPTRILVVEDEFLIRTLLEDMLVDLGHEVAASAATVDEARKLAVAGGFALAILDVNLEGQEIFPVAEILAERKLPFIFVTG